MLHILDAPPAGLTDAEPDELLALLGGPTLIEWPGRRETPVFVSVLLHGNETTGWYAARELLRKYRDRPLPRALSLFIGNVEAAAQGLRRLDGQPDYNRVWPGSETAGTPEHALMAEVTERLRKRHAFASIDVHNNTGLNPHYACINHLRQDAFHLATLFSRTVVHFTRPLGVQSLAFSALCPAVTIEAGRPGDASGVRHVVDFLDTVLHLPGFSDRPPSERDMDLFHTIATVTIPPDIPFHFAADEDPAPDPRFRLNPELERLNFREVDAGAVFGQAPAGMDLPLRAQAEDGGDVTCHYFRMRGREVQLARPVMPAMLTLDEPIIRQDCLGYLMERLHLNRPRSAPENQPPPSDPAPPTSTPQAATLMSNAALWSLIRREAATVARDEPILGSFYHAVILKHARFEDALSFHLATKLGDATLPALLLREVIAEACAADPGIPAAALADIDAVVERDPAVDRYAVPFLYLKGLHALQTYRVAHWLWNQNRRHLALHLQSLGSTAFDVDIHPAARIGQGILFDHATGIVIGETAVVEDEVSILHEVTLGGSGKEHGDRHPKVRTGVMIGAGAKILGNVEIGEGAKVGAGSVVLEDVPAHTTVVGVPAQSAGRCVVDKPALDMNQAIFMDDPCQSERST